MKRETGSGVPHNQSRNASLFSIEGEKVSSKLPTKLVGEADSLPGGASFAGENVQSHGGVSQENALSTSENLSPQASVPRLPNVGVATKADAMAYDTAVIFPSKERVCEFNRGSFSFIVTPSLEIQVIWITFCRIRVAYNAI